MTDDSNCSPTVFPCTIACSALATRGDAFECARCERVLSKNDDGTHFQCGFIEAFDPQYSDDFGHAQNWITTSHAAQTGAWGEVRSANYSPVQRTAAEKMMGPVTMDVAWETLTFPESLWNAALLGLPVGAIADVLSERLAAVQAIDAVNGFLIESLHKLPAWTSIVRAMPVAELAAPSPLPFSVVAAISAVDKSHPDGFEEEETEHEFGGLRQLGDDTAERTVENDLAAILDDH